MEKYRINEGRTKRSSKFIIIANNKLWRDVNERGLDWNFNGHENRVVHRIKCFHLIHRGSVSKMLSVKRSSNFTIMTPWQEFSLAEINFDLFVSSPTRRFSNEMIYRFHPSLLIEWKLLLFDVWKINFFF